MSKQHLINDCVELVTVNGRSFNLLADSGFKKILDPIKLALTNKTKDKEFSLSPESIQKYISLEANELKQKIMEEIKTCMVSIKVDGVTRLDRAFLGINIQYVKNGQIVLRTLALKEIRSQHTDNGSNLLKAIKVIASENGDYEVIEINDIEFKSDEDWGENLGNIEVIVEDDPAELNFSSGRDNLFQSYHDLNNEDDSTSRKYNLNITGMRCAAHTLQLAVEDALTGDKKLEK
ncbi:unnamed protein product [Psylliodes chrysocephalus]|uniref:Uncharacterized protein n=1 Tax=Psylliodes chrysocephalus TaxID=3402493 RepID=A0A9P0CZ82_9CUCU|nr:unnamed protein product [Psylliodes chrysocephala]